jgi:hypothetical protein
MRCEFKTSSMLAIAIVLCADPCSAAQTRDRLDGWGPFKFTMDRAQAMAAVKGRAENGPSGQMIYKVEVDGAPWTAEVRFLSDPHGSIRNISLAPLNMPSASSADECRSAWRALITRVEQKYGPHDDENQWTIPVLNQPARGAFFRFRDASFVEVDTSYDAVRRGCTVGVVYSAGKRGAKSDF